MSWTDKLGGLLKQYSSGGAAAKPAPDVNAHFDQVAQAAPNSTIAEGLAAAFRSSSTPSFAQSVANLFAHSNAEQKTGVLNSLIRAANPGVLSGILSKAGIQPSSADGHLAPQEAQKVPPKAVHDIAAHAEQNNPSIVEEVSRFYAQHPTLVKTLGTAAVSVLLTKIAERH